MSELHGEKIDIVDWSEDPAELVAHALSPARVNSVEVIDLEARSARVVVPDFQLSLAIGKEGQNARLAARLTGWRIDIRSDEEPTGRPARPTAMRSVLRVSRRAVCPVRLRHGDRRSRASPVNRRLRGRGPSSASTARPGADSPTGFGADGDDVLVSCSARTGRCEPPLGRRRGLPGRRADRDRGRRLSRLRRPGPARRHLVAGRLGRHGGRGQRRDAEFAPRVLRSQDGLSWEPVQVTGIPGPVDLHVGRRGGRRPGRRRRQAQRRSTPAVRAFNAAAWRSEDGSRLDRGRPARRRGPAGLPRRVGVALWRRPGIGSWPAEALGQRAALWASDDAGRSGPAGRPPWTTCPGQRSGRRRLDRARERQHQERPESAGGRLLRSDDGGLTLGEAEDQPAPTARAARPLWAGGGRYFTLTEPGFDLYFDPGVCYADLAQLRRRPRCQASALIHASNDGDSWSVVDTATPTWATSSREPSAPLTGVRLRPRRPGRPGDQRWPGGTAFPEGRPPAGPDRVDLVQVAEGATPSPVSGTTPRSSSTAAWTGSTSATRPGSGPTADPTSRPVQGTSSPQGWPLVGQTIYGYATLSDPGVVEYSIGGDDDEVIATYEKTGAQAPGCD